MILKCHGWIKSAGVMVMSVCATAAFAQAEASASPELGSKPQVEKTTIVAPQETSAAVSDAAPASTPEAATDASADAESSAKKSIDQRVDGTQPRPEPIKVAPRPKKNVQRIDNLPNKPKVVPKAVIKGPVSPWGYAGRYAAGEVNRPSAQDLQGKVGQPGAPGQAGAAAPSTGGFRGASRGKRDD